jgi:parvulin-like peptidyl-prolyl isomerase
MGAQVQTLKVGEKTSPVGSGAECTVIMLDKFEDGPVPALPAVAKDGIRKVLAERKKNLIIDSWIADLRKKAVISNK